MPRTFFLEQSLGGLIVRGALIEAGYAVEVHIDHFDQDAPDEIWLAGIAGRGWILLTKDGRIRKRVIERKALNEAGVHAFFLGNRQLTGVEMARAFVKAIPKIIALVDASHLPVLGSVHRDGRVTQIPSEFP